VVITQQCWVLNELWQAFPGVVRLWQNRVRHRWLLTTGAGDYDNRASNLHQLSIVAPRRVLHGLMYRLNITTSMTYRILECRKDHTNQLMEHGVLVPSDGEEEW
jgi:hypothetical protein